MEKCSAPTTGIPGNPVMSPHSNRNRHKALEKREEGEPGEGVACVQPPALLFFFRRAGGCTQAREGEAKNKAHFQKEWFTGMRMGAHSIM